MKLFEAIYTIYYLLKFKIFKKGVTIGNGLRIHGRLDIRGNGKVIIGNNCRFGIMPGSSKHVTLYTHDKNATIKIGDRVELYGSMISSRFEIIVHDDVVIEETSISDTDFHAIGKDRHVTIEESINRNRIIIEDNVSIGARSIITKGVTVGKGTIVGPGSVVIHSLPANNLAMGNPARIVKKSQES